MAYTRNLNESQMASHSPMACDTPIGKPVEPKPAQMDEIIKHLDMIHAMTRGLIIDFRDRLDSAKSYMCHPEPASTGASCGPAPSPCRGPIEGKLNDIEGSLSELVPLVAGFRELFG